MAPNVTQANDDDVTLFLESVSAEPRRADGRAVRELMERVTGAPARMWGSAIVGFGDSSYTNRSGTHEWFVVGFSPRKAATVIYGVLDDEPEQLELLAELGRHSIGKSCLNVPELDAVDRGVLERIVDLAWRRATT